VGVLRECAGGGGSGISSVTVSGCIGGDGSVGSPIYVMLDPMGGLACGGQGLYTTGGGGGGSGTGCAIAFSYDNSTQTSAPSVPVEPGSFSPIQVEVKNNAINFWNNPGLSGTWILDKTFSGAGADSFLTWYVVNSTNPATQNTSDMWRTGQVGIGSQYEFTASIGGGNGAEIALGQNNRKTKVAIYDNGTASAGIGSSGSILGIHTASGAWDFGIYEEQSWSNRHFYIDMASGTITLDDYPDSRNDTSEDPFDNFLYTDPVGTLRATPHYFVGEVNNGSSGGAKLINFTTRGNHFLLLTDNCTLTFTAPASPRSTLIRFAQNGTGGHSVTFPGTVLGSAVIATGVSEQTVINLYYDGTNWHI
jgi:hypothetical protein